MDKIDVEIEVGGIWVKVPQQTTGAQIKQLAGVEDQRTLTLWGPVGPRIVPSGERLSVSSTDKFEHLMNWEYGIGGDTIDCQVLTPLPS